MSSPTRSAGGHAPPPPASRVVARVLVPFAILGGATALLAISGARAFERLPEVRVMPVALIPSEGRASGVTSNADDAASVQAPGWIEPAPFATELRALRDGTITEVRVLEGASVARGDVIALLEHAEEEIALAEADATLAARQREAGASAELAEIAARAADIAADSGERMHAAEAAAAEARILADRLPADLAAAEAELAEARDLLDTRKALIAPGGATEGEVRRLGLRVESLAARVEALRLEMPSRRARAEALANSVKIARRARESLIAERTALVEARRMEAKVAAELAEALAARDRAALALRRSEIRAPHAGTILSRSAVVGARAGREGEPIARLYDPTSLQVRCDVPAKDAAFLAIGLPAEIRADALPDRVLEGVVERLVPLGDLQKNTVQCKVRIVDPPTELRADMLVRVKIRARGAGGSAQREAVAIPVRALLVDESVPTRGSSGEVLVAIPETGAVRIARRAVVVGSMRANGWIEIDEGLVGGDRVVLPNEAIDEAPSTAIATLATTLDGARATPREVHLGEPYVSTVESQRDGGGENEGGGENDGGGDERAGEGAGERAGDGEERAS